MPEILPWSGLISWRDTQLEALFAGLGDGRGCVRRLILMPSDQAHGSGHRGEDEDSLFWARPVSTGSGWWSKPARERQTSGKVFKLDSPWLKSVPPHLLQKWPRLVYRAQKAG